MPRPLQLPDGLDEMGQGAGKPIQPPDDQSVLGTKLEESRPVTVTEPETVHLAKERGLRAEILQRVLGFGSYETAWAWMHKLRRVMVRPDREQFMGDVELDEVFVGGRSTGRMGAGTGKVPIMVAVERGEGRRLGRVRMQVADRPNTAATLEFAHDVVAEGSTIHTDGTRLFRRLGSMGLSPRIHEQISDP